MTSNKKIAFYVPDSNDYYPATFYVDGTLTHHFRGGDRQRAWKVIDGEVYLQNRYGDWKLDAFLAPADVKLAYEMYAAECILLGDADEA